MNFELSYSNVRLSKGLSNIRSHWGSGMEGRPRRAAFAGAQSSNYKRPLPQGIMTDHKRPLPQGDRNYYSLESFMVLVCLTASLLILPLILPPLPPPPFLLLLLPVGILLVLLVLAFMPSNVRDLASSYL